jgi:hypothetical protein
MPTVPRRPAAQSDRLNARRLRAAELFAASVHQTEVARQFEVSAQAMGVWHARWKERGIDTLYSRGQAARRPGCPMTSSKKWSGPCWLGYGEWVHRRVVDPGPNRHVAISLSSALLCTDVAAANSRLAAATAGR